MTAEESTLSRADGDTIAQMNDAVKAASDASEAEWRALSDEHKIRLWEKHEDIAMHFNDLTLRLRLQALAGVGASALIAGSIFSHQGQVDLHMLGFFLLAVAIVWTAVWIVDEWYYQPLLKGAVQRIVLVEQWTPGVRVSTAIEKAVGPGGRVARRAFYLLILLVLSLGGVAALRS